MKALGIKVDRSSNRPTPNLGSSFEKNAEDLVIPEYLMLNIKYKIKVNSLLV